MIAERKKNIAYKRSDIFAPILVHEYLTYSTDKYPEKEALIFGDKRITYSSLDKITDKFAQALIELGTKRHDRVIVFSDNAIETVFALYGILKTGATFIILNGALKAPKLQYIINDSGATLVIAQSRKYETVELALCKSEVKPKLIWFGENVNLPDSLLPISFMMNTLISESANNHHLLEQRKSKIIDYDLSALIYTSGSTGEPKGVMSSHFNMISAARSIIKYLRNQPEDIILNVLPLSFDYGLYQVIMSVMFGGTVVIEPSFMFPIKILQKLEQEHITGFPIVPTILTMLLNIESLTNYDLSALRYISNTGAALPVEHIRTFRNIFPQVQIFSMFGLTECKRISYLPPEEIDAKTSSVGKAMPNCEVFIVDGQGKQVKSGEIGELVVRGSNVMRGYWNAEELTNKVYRNGNVNGEKLLYTGDFFKQDEDGYLYFAGRKDDMIKTKGERVSPKEIENSLCSMNGIKEIAIIGIPDKLFGQIIKAYIVKTSKSKITEKEVLKYCSDNMEVFMVPKYIEFIDDLPKIPNGKIDKKTLLRLNKSNV